MIVIGKIWCSSTDFIFSCEDIIWAMWIRDVAWSGFSENVRIIFSASCIATSELTEPYIFLRATLMAGGINFLLLILLEGFSESRFLRKINKQKLCYNTACVWIASHCSDVLSPMSKCWCIIINNWHRRKLLPSSSWCAPGLYIPASYYFSREVCIILNRFLGFYPTWCEFRLSCLTQAWQN